LIKGIAADGGPDRRAVRRGRVAGDRGAAGSADRCGGDRIASLAADRPTAVEALNKFAYGTRQYRLRPDVFDRVGEALELVAGQENTSRTPRLRRR